MGGVHDRRARAKAPASGEELDGPDSVLGEALVDLARLLVGVDVEDELLLLGIASYRLEPVRRAGADGVGGNADCQATGAQIVNLAEVLVDRGLTEAIGTASPVGGIEQHEADTGGLGRLRRSERLVEAEIVELAHSGIARGAHLSVGDLVLAADGFRRLLLGVGDHAVPPAPEVRAFLVPAKHTLERVAVSVDEAGNRQRLRHSAH